VKSGAEDITRNLILQWAYDGTVIDLYESDDDGDAAVFQSAVTSIFGPEGLLKLASDPACPNRFYFAELLSKYFLWMYRHSVELPFHTSRFRGIMSRQEYRNENMKREDEIYNLCLVLDSMRSIDDPAVQSLYKQILDFRGGQGEYSSKFYFECCSKLDLKLFKTINGL
jgi:hypothetical protein